MHACWTRTPGKPILSNTVVALKDVGNEAFRSRRGRRRWRLWRSGTGSISSSLASSLLAERIRAQQPNLPIVLASAYGDLAPQDIRLPRLQKPFTQRELLQSICVARRLRRKEATPTSTSSRPP
jgi:hypothetical protein